MAKQRYVTPEIDDLGAVGDITGWWFLDELFETIRGLPRFPGAPGRPGGLPDAVGSV